MRTSARLLLATLLVALTVSTAAAKPTTGNYGIYQETYADSGAPLSYIVDTVTECYEHLASIILKPPEAEAPLSRLKSRFRRFAEIVRQRL